MKLELSKNKLSSNIQSIGGTQQDFIQIDLEGRKVFFNDMPLEDEVLPEILLKARDLAVATTNEAFNKEDIDLNKVEENHITNHQELMAFFKKNTGLDPEEIPTESNIKKLDEES